MQKSELLEQVKSWISDDLDEMSAGALAKLLQAEDWATLEDSFSGFLKFGTAGLRGEVGPGPNRMNRAMVIRASIAFCEHIVASQGEDAKAHGIVVGYDARIDSRRFAEDIVAIARGLGLKVHFFREAVPTPLVAFAIKRLGAAAGVCVTASHNPPQYNGYKVFWNNGAQIIPPHDKEVAARMMALTHLKERYAELGAAHIGDLVELADELGADYLAAVEAVSPPHEDAPLSVAYSAMHGVGGTWAMKLLGSEDNIRVESVTEQFNPDGSFPTVNFPNPEEESALKLLIETMSSRDCELGVANDPDADRLAVVVRHDGEFVALNGNQIGTLLAHFLLETLPAEKDASKALLVSTIVSSPLLGDIAKAHGARYLATLTGHKWIHNRAMELEQDGFEFLFGYEEAIGFAVGDNVRDKDGLSALKVIVAAAQHYKASGKTLVDVLEDMSLRYGGYQSDQVSVVLQGKEGRAEIAAALTRARQIEFGELAGLNIVAKLDYVSRERTTTSGADELPAPADNVIGFELEGGHRIMARPSGTEPKLKMYFDYRFEIDSSAELDAAQEKAAAKLAEIVSAFRSRLAV